MELSEEEKKAIEILKEIKDVRGIRQDVEGENEDLYALDIVYNLTEKLLKEIEELKENELLEITENFISKDKIRELIKKYQEKAEDVKQKYKGGYASKSDYLEALAKIEGYQELLEEN